MRNYYGKSRYIANNLSFRTVNYFKDNKKLSCKNLKNDKKKTAQLKYLSAALSCSYFLSTK